MNDLRSRIAEALNTAPAARIRDTPALAADHASNPRSRHDRHRYDGRCAACRGETDTLTDAVIAALGETAPGGPGPAAQSPTGPAALGDWLAARRDETVLLDRDGAAWQKHATANHGHGALLRAGCETAYNLAAPGDLAELAETYAPFTTITPAGA